MKQIKIHGWDGFQFSVNDLSLIVVPDIGGRIVSLCYKGQEMFFVQPEHAGETFDFMDGSDLSVEKIRMGFRLWGGDKTWVAPENEWWQKIPPLELDAGQYSFNLQSDQIQMTSRICQETGLAITRTVNVNDQGIIRLGQTLINRSNQDVYKGIWNVTQLLRPVEVYIPSNISNVRSYHLEDSTLPKHTVVVQDIDGLACISCQDNQLFKFGAMINTGAVLCLRRMDDGILAFMKIFDIAPKGSYLHRSMVEVFNSRDYDYMEVEVHSSATVLKPGQELSHSQIWCLKFYPKIIKPREIFEDLINIQEYRWND